MAWKEVGPANNTIDIKQKGKDFSIEGIYTGHREFDSQFGGTQTVWNLRTEAGIVGIYSFTDLTRRMEGVTEGSLVRITYLGKEWIESKRGKVQMHKCKVEVDDAASADTDDMPDTYPASSVDPDEVYPATSADRMPV